jgi:multicomponent K+:H+ antiporter subunit E
MSRGRQGPSLKRWLERGILSLQLLGRFLVELVIANLQQARLVLGHPLRVQPRWIRYETQLRSRASRTLLGALISLTPGTLTCDLQDETLLIHALNASSDEEAIQRIRRQFESVLMRMEAV